MNNDWENVDTAPYVTTISVIDNFLCIARMVALTNSHLAIEPPTFVDLLVANPTSGGGGGGGSGDGDSGGGGPKHPGKPTDTTKTADNDKRSADKKKRVPEIRLEIILP